MTKVLPARNWFKNNKSVSIDNAQKLHLSTESKQFLTKFYQDTQTIENNYIEKDDGEVTSLSCWIESGSQSESDFRKGASPFHMSLMSDSPLATVVEEPRRRPPKLNKRYSSLPDNCPLPETCALHDCGKTPRYEVSMLATDLKKRRKQLEYIHSMRIQEQYFDSLFEKCEGESLTAEEKL